MSRKNGGERMAYQITEADKRLILQRDFEVRARIEVLDSTDRVINTITGGITGGNSSIDAESAVRRTCSLTIKPNAQSALEIAEDGIIWLDKKIKIYLGIEDSRTGEYTFWANGVYVFMNTSASYDQTTDQLSLSCSDMMAFLDGTRNGTLGQLIIQYPAYEEDEETGEVIKYNYIRDALKTTITQLPYCNKFGYNIDDMGEAKGMPHYLPDWDYMAYREQSKVPVKDGTLMETWNAIPYDLEFSSGATILDIVAQLRDLYENYETYFDEEGIFCCNMIPSGDDDIITFNDDYLQKILISEDLSLDFTEVRNVCETWGESYETDFYSESVSYSGNVYSSTIEGYDEKYYNGDTIALKIPAKNSASSSININSLGNIPIYDENTENALSADRMEANKTYAFKVKSKYINGSSVMRIYLLGQWQAHGMDVITDGTVGEPYTSTSGVTSYKWSEEWFKTVYNCESVHLTVLPDSPFTVQKLGVILQVVNDDNISSDALAVENARQNTWRKCRLTDSISITTKLCPFADVNIKVSYRPHSDEETHEYIVKSISHDWYGGTTSWSLMRYHRLYLVTSED